DWHQAARGSAGSELRSAGNRPEATRRHGAGDRADGERWRAGNAVARRQVDSRHEGRKLERPLRTLRGSDEERACDINGVVVGCQLSVRILSSDCAANLTTDN